MGILDDLRAGRRAPASAEAGADGTVPALLFIPDISGFTRFIEQSGSPLAPQLIADLLEVLIEANLLDMQVSEIQGDAILFYRLGPPPAIEELVRQCRRLFLDFQRYLQLMERDTGSALSADLRHQELTLKIIVHYGRISVAQIRQFTKLMGREVIVVHRLLKNNITSDEYVLLSDDYLATQDAAALTRSFSWTRLLRGTCHYDYLGEVCYRYAHLSPLRLLLSSPSGSAHEQGNVLTATQPLRVSASYALRVISNFRLRPNWMPGVRNVQYDVSKAGRLGTSYKVEFSRGQIDFQTVQRFEAPDQLEYVEKITLFRIFPNALLFYLIEPLAADACRVTLEFRYGSVASPRALVRFGQLRRMRLFLAVAVRRLAALCEHMTRR